MSRTSAHQGKRYLAKDLARILDVPSSTLKDWLERFPEHIESESRGKRTVYTENTRRALERVAQWKRQGVHPVEIENRLAEDDRQHPPPPQTHASPERNKAESNDPDQSDKPRPSDTPATPRGHHQEERLNTILEALRKLERRGQNLEQALDEIRGRIHFATAVLVIAALLILAALAALFFR